MTDCQSRSGGFFPQEKFRGPSSPACFVPTSMLVYMHFEAAQAVPEKARLSPPTRFPVEEKVANFLADQTSIVTQTKKKKKCQVSEL